MSDGPGMSEDEVMEALGELYREGKVDMVPTIGSVDPEEQRFTLTDSGVDYGRELLSEDDDMVLYLYGLHLSRYNKREHGGLAEYIDDFATWVAEDAGVNLFRVIDRTDKEVPGFKTTDFDEDFLERYDAEGGDAEDE